MSRLRFTLIVLALITVCASQIAAWQGNKAPANTGGPALGKWKFTAKESTGVVWTGTLTLGKIDPERFSVDKFHSLCNIEAVSEKGGMGVEHPTTYDASTRTLTIGTEGKWGGSTYTAVLSPDGKRLEKGKWKRTERDFGTKELRVVSTGDWSADLEN